MPSSWGSPAAGDGNKVLVVFDVFRCLFFDVFHCFLMVFDDFLSLLVPQGLSDTLAISCH